MSCFHVQRGAATLGITLVLLLALALAAGFAQRRHVGELRSATTRFHASQAFEAAEAGIDWTLAMLNEPATGFRDRHLAIAADTGVIAPSGRRAACALVGEAWRCGDDATDSAATAAFEIDFAAASGPGAVHLASVGCRKLPCTQASSRLDITLGLVPALAHPPLAALTVHDDVDAGAAALGLHNGDAASGGIVVHAGGAVRAPGARFSGPAGVPAPTLVEHDDTLHTMDPERLFASLFGLDKALWRRQPTVKAIACSGRCNGELTQALTTHRLVVVDGDLDLDGATTLGTRECPVIVVATGALRLRGDVVVHGLVYGTRIAWNDTGSGALVRGALVSETGYAGNGTPNLIHDRAVLSALKSAGTFARLPGSWKDFR